jgi:GH15 family glucan-1,4-alpha-glucosidase
MRRSTPYVPIGDYGLIGNRHTCALVSRDGSIDWCCLPYLESPSVFAAVLDAARGGRFVLSPEAWASCEREYVGCSAVLRTTFRTASGVLRLHDFLPIRQGRGEEVSHSEHTIVRIAECLEGHVDVHAEWTPRPNYARDDLRVERPDALVMASGSHGPLWIAGLPAGEPTEVRDGGAHARVTLRRGEALHVLSGWGDAPAGEPRQLAERYLKHTLEWWERWESDCDVAPEAAPWRAQVLRSGMVLKLLTNERSGAMAAAPTTSLPEELGGIRNWDYRFCWVRDASMTTRAFITLGQRRDGVAFLQFLERAAQQHNDPSRIQVLYGLNGETCLPEYTLGHLDGYAGSGPVRVGNDAALQRQLDVYGELLQAAFELLRIGAALTPEQEVWLQGVADHVCGVWRLPDRGIWEVRGPDRQFTYSKLMCWVALDRAIRISDRLGWERDTSTWREEREEIRSAILQEGYDASQRSFVQTFGGTQLDASSLLIPLVRFLPASDPRVQGTIDATLRDLTEGGLVHRYLPETAGDGVGGGEGAFVICTFWLIDALALSGRTAEARELFGAMLGLANDLGLYAEEVDPRTGAFLGNFPQAFSHVGLINSAHFLGRALVAQQPGNHGMERDVAQVQD